LSVAFAAIVTDPLTVAPFAGDVSETFGGVVSPGDAFWTFTVTPAAVVMLPAASRARAVSVWLPLDVVAEFHEIEYGLVMSSVPTFAPSSRNCTPMTATLSDALAETVTVPPTVDPLAGAVIDTGCCRTSLTLPFH
jgi:hypothetical protein